MAKQTVMVNGVRVSDRVTVNYVAGTRITITITDDGQKTNIQFDKAS